VLAIAPAMAHFVIMSPVTEAKTFPPFSPNPPLNALTKRKEAARFPRL
jgi:hypothetical protein